jgi:hypothetical protein
MLIRYGDEPQPSQLTLLCNTGEGGLFSNVSSACARNLPTIGEQAIVCGGGPSLEDSLETIRQLKAGGAKIFALNNSAQFLVGKGIKPDYQILLDPRPQNVALHRRAVGARAPDRLAMPSVAIRSGREDRLSHDALASGDPRH